MKTTPYLFLSILCAALFLSCSDDDDKLKVGFSGNNILGKASIERDKIEKKAYLNIDMDGEWSLYAGLDADHIDLNKPILSDNIKGKYPLDVITTGRSYFQLVTKDGNAILAEKHLPMEGGYNFRDLGGIQTKDGRYVKWGKIFRTDDLHKLTEKDLTYLSSIPITSVVDFRSEAEIEKDPDILPPSVKNKHKLSLYPGNLEALGEEVLRLKPDEIDQIMRDMNVQFVTDPVCIKEYKTFFELLQKEENLPLLFHCTAGKDRTGMGSCLFLASLGVDEETILSDYFLSNTYLADKYAHYVELYPSLKTIFEVKKEYLKAAIDRMKKDHGSIENFLTKELGVDTDKMKNIYLY